MSAPTRTPRSVARTLLASAVSLALALGGATLVLGCGGTMTGDDGTAGSGTQTAAASMPGMAATPARAIEIQEVTSPGGVKAWLVEEQNAARVSVMTLY